MNQIGRIFVNPFQYFAIMMIGGQSVLEKGIKRFDCYAICFDSTLNMISMKLNAIFRGERIWHALDKFFVMLINRFFGLCIRGRSFDALLRHLFHNFVFSPGWSFVIFFLFFWLLLQNPLLIRFYIESSPSEEPPIGLLHFDKFYKLKS